jgi:hypothetical protein
MLGQSRGKLVNLVGNPDVQRLLLLPLDPC